MESQWDCFLQNLGAWEGSFTRLSPQGDCLEDIPSLVSFEAQENNTIVRQVVRRYPAPSQIEEQEYLLRSLNRSTLFFENGAFSQGSIQWSPVAEFGAEFGFLAGDRRLRLVQLYDKTSHLSSFTLIREKLVGTNAPERPPLTVEALLGTWKGEATTLYPNWRSPDNFSTQLTVTRLDGQTLQQQLSFGDYILQSQGRIEGSRIYFEKGESPIQVCLLADGASANCPLWIKPRQAFLLEVGWLLSPRERQRMIRRYDDRGGWVSLTLIQETKL